MKKLLLTVTLLSSLLLLNDAFAQGLDDASRAEKQGNITSTLHLWMLLAERGDADAQYHLALMYEDGNGVTQNDKKAAEWYEKAAARGKAKAQYNLARMYNTGKLGTRNYKKAAELLEKAAAQRNAEAQYTLAWMYENGNGVKQNYKKAAELYAKATHQGIAKAAFNLGVMYLQGRGVTKNRENASELIKKSAEQGMPAAQTVLGIMYTTGMGGTENYILGYMWLNIASSNGSNEAEEQRNALEKSMPKEDVLEAQKLARVCSESYYTLCR